MPNDEAAELVEKCVQAAYRYGRAWERFEARVKSETPGERQRLWDAMNAALDELNRHRSSLVPAIREQHGEQIAREIELALDQSPWAAGIAAAIARGQGR